MDKKIEIVKDLMSKYNLTDKDLFSFCICAVNFLEYYEEEAMCDVMYHCPSRYSNSDSDNTRAVAGALNGEKKAKGWTDEEQFFYYMKRIQHDINEDIDNLSHFLSECDRFEKVYRREIFVPIMLGCPVEDYDDSRFLDSKYLKSIVNADNLTFYKVSVEKKEEKMRIYREKEAAAVAKEVKEKKNDEDFSILLASPTNVSRLKNVFEEYNKKYYPDRDYKVVPLHNPELMIIQTGGKSVEEVKDRVLETSKRTILFIEHEVQGELIPVEEAFKTVPKTMEEYKVTHVVVYT